MKLRISFLLGMLLFAGTMAKAQDAAVTDEELDRYVTMMDSINDMSDTLLDSIKNMVASNEQVSNARYMELSKIIDDEAKLTEAKATPEEVAFINKVKDMKETGTKKIQETYQAMAKEYVGADAYNKVRKALKADKAFKEKYDARMAELKKEDDA